MYPQDQNNFQTQQNNYPGSGNWQNNTGENPDNSKMKKRIYTIIQIIAVIGLLVSLPILVLGIINVAPHLRQTAKTTGVISKISDDLGGIIDKSTNGRTGLSNGCTINYEFSVANDIQKGFSHSDKYCNKSIREEVPITYNLSSPSDNSIATDTSFYAFLFWIGLALMIINIVLIIFFSSKKRQIILRESHHQF